MTDLHEPEPKSKTLLVLALVAVVFAMVPRADEGFWPYNNIPKAEPKKKAELKLVAMRQWDDFKEKITIIPLAFPGNFYYHPRYSDGACPGFGSPSVAGTTIARAACSRRAESVPWARAKSNSCGGACLARGSAPCKGRRKPRGMGAGLPARSAGRPAPIPSSSPGGGCIMDSGKE